jgi:hypothetical protein
MINEKYHRYWNHDGGFEDDAFTISFCRLESIAMNNYVRNELNGASVYDRDATRKQVLLSWADAMNAPVEETKAVFNGKKDAEAKGAKFISQDGKLYPLNEQARDYLLQFTVEGVRSRRKQVNND